MCRVTDRSFFFQFGHGPDWVEGTIDRAGVRERVRGIKQVSVLSLMWSLDLAASYLVWEYPEACLYLAAYWKGMLLWVQCVLSPGWKLHLLCSELSP